MRVAKSLTAFVVVASTLAWFGCSTDDGNSSGDGAASGSGGTTGGSAGSSGSASGGSSGGSSGASPGSGGSAGAAAGGSGGTTGGTAGSSGSGGDGGTAGAGAGCKRGIASNVAPGAEFFPGVSWWYNWAIQGTGQGAGIEFVPMVWGSATVGDGVPEGSKYLLGFNEPNFFVQANLSAADAAGYWPELETMASAANLPLVSPGMNFCGPAEDCHDTNPYDYLKDFFAACEGCDVDYVAVHWYNCDLPSLKDYLEPGNNLEGFEQFGKPIWITEFSCDPSATVEEQEAFMREAIPYLEAKENVFRYSWFSADPIPNAELVNDDGSPTALGEVYIGLEQSCD